MDLALMFTEHGDFDLAVEGRDLVGDPGPAAPLTVSLFTDRLARIDDPLPEYLPGRKSDRRGWWGDAEGDHWADPIGSRLWLLHREKELLETVARAKEYVREALAWIEERAGLSEVKVTDEGRGRLKIEARVKIPGLDERDKNSWTALLDLTKPSRANLLGVH
jgi:phage gp46-like protein